jgi:cell division protease FtsH
MDQKQRQFSIWYVFIALWALMLFQMFVTPFFNPTEIPYSEFKKALEDGQVTEIAVSTTLIHGKMKDDKVFNTIRVDDPDLIRNLEKHHVKVTGVIETTFLRDLLSWVVPVALFFGLWWFMFRRMGQSQGFLTVGRSKAKIYMKRRPRSALTMLRGSMRRNRNFKKWLSF